MAFRGKVFRRRDIFCKFSWHRRDFIGPRIVEIGAVLAIFRPFEVFGRFFDLQQEEGNSAKFDILS